MSTLQIQYPEACCKTVTNLTSMDFSFADPFAFVFSTVPDNDNEAEFLSAGALSLSARRGGGGHRAGLLSLQPGTGAQGDIHIREDLRGALFGC